MHLSSNCSSLGESTRYLQTIGIFNKYPVGVFNPAFTGMYLWELSSSHELNDYQICRYHSIKSGIILYGSEAYVFTQITNNDIISHLKILIRWQKYRNDMYCDSSLSLTFLVFPFKAAFVFL